MLLCQLTLLRQSFHRVCMLVRSSVSACRCAPQRQSAGRPGRRAIASHKAKPRRHKHPSKPDRSHVCAWRSGGPGGAELRVHVRSLWSVAGRHARWRVAAELGQEEGRHAGARTLPCYSALPCYELGGVQ